jgi:endonuclease-3
MLSAQTTDVNVNRVTQTAVREVPAPGGLPRRAAGGAGAGRLRHGASFARRRSRSRARCECCWRSSTARCRARSTSCCGCPASRARPPTSSPPSSANPQGIVVDTHVRRLSQRLGLTRREDPVKIERDLVKLVPRADWGRFPHLLIWHAAICGHRPRCEMRLIALCPSAASNRLRPHRAVPSSRRNRQFRDPVTLGTQLPR